MEKRKYTDRIEVGVDEAGRGCLAGPVVAACFVVPKDFDPPPLLNDSKKMSAGNRLIVFDHLVKTYPANCRINLATNVEIDEVNVLNATFMAMHRALDNLAIPYDIILVDGNMFKPGRDVPHECVVKGDSKYASIAAASVLAKVFRDMVMMNHANNEKYAVYEWDINKGYPTTKHCELIKKHGLSDLHRRTFSYE